MIDTKYVGCRIQATAPRRRALRGIVLPPAPRSRNGAMRLAVDGRAPIKFDPEQWTITVLGWAVYGYGELPTEHLATRTMLKAEKRLEPAKGAPVVAQYKVRKGTVPLYAVADAVPLAVLSPARAEAWAAARTCTRCGEQRPRPITRYRDGARRCGKCQQAVAFERWAEQTRAVQAEITQWARGILADSRTLLITRGHQWHRQHIRIETVAGGLVTDVHVRDIEDLDAWQAKFYADKPADEIEAWRAKYDGTISKTDFMPTVASLEHARLVAWHTGDASSGHSLPCVQWGDDVNSRLALWSGEAPFRSGDWFPEPRLPWSFYPMHYQPHCEHRHLRGDVPLDQELAHLRKLIELMATQPAPEPYEKRREAAP